MKKLISIGVALAILAMVVLPLGAAAAECDIVAGNITYKAPASFAKIPFAILESGFTMVGGILGPLAATLGLPPWLDDVVNLIGPWTGGPLAWTVDMLAWGLDLVAAIIAPLAVPLGLPTWLDDLVSGIACGLFTPYSCNVTGGNFTPCSPS